MRNTFSRLIPLASLTFGASVLAPFAAADAILWNALSTKQRAQVLKGEQIRVDGSKAGVWGSTFYQWVKPMTKTAAADPEGAAAIFWDLKGQVEYLKKFDFAGVEILSGEGTAALRTVVTSLSPVPGGYKKFEYPQENCVFRVARGGSIIYSSSWHSNDSSRSEYPGFLDVWGDVSFERFPGDNGGTLLAYRAVTIPAAELAASAPLRDNVYSFYAGIVRAHVERMAKGATPEQLRRLRKALGPP